jgi:hypothetical protein
MQQIGDWLEKLGMSEYAQCFAESDIDIAVLRHLTDQDLKELGVSLGHRRKMLAAIAEHADTLTASPKPAPTEQIPQSNLSRSLKKLPSAAKSRCVRLSGSLAKPHRAQQ